MDKETIIAHLEETLTPMGYECLDVALEDLENLTLTLYIDSPNGILIDDCIKVSKKLDEDTELDKLVPGPYTLEVSSPGIDRPLRLLRHFQDVLNQNIRVVFNEPLTESQREAEGKLIKISDESELFIESPKRSISVSLPTIIRANLIGPWNSGGI